MAVTATSHGPGAGRRARLRDLGHCSLELLPRLCVSVRGLDGGLAQWPRIQTGIPFEADTGLAERRLRPGWLDGRPPRRPRWLDSIPESQARPMTRGRSTALTSEEQP